MQNPAGMKNCLPFSKLSSSATQRPKSGLPLRTSSATSNNRPRAQLISLACAWGGRWQWRPRTVPISRDIKKLSCTNSLSIPTANSVFLFQVSQKNPRSSSNFQDAITLHLFISNILDWHYSLYKWFWHVKIHFPNVLPIATAEYDWHIQSKASQA